MLFHSFKGCFKILAGEDYEQMFFDFSRDERRRSNVIIKARIQPFCLANGINIGYINGNEVFPRFVTERYKALRS